MTTSSPTPQRVRTPSWFDLRLLLGLVLVVGSVAFGAIVMSRGNATGRVLAVDHDLAAGTVLTDDDVRVVRVHLSGDVSEYLNGASTVSGRILLRDVGDGELLPAAALGSANPDETSLTVPVKPENAPDLERGQRVAIWVSTPYCRAVAVLADVTIQGVREAGTGALSAASEASLVIRVSRPLAQRVVTALGLDGATVRIGVVTGTDAAEANMSLPDLATCAAPERS